MYKLLFISILTLVLSGCGFPSKNDTVLKNSNNIANKLNDISIITDSADFERDIKEIIKKNIEKDFGINNNLVITEINTFENSSFIIFLLNKSNTLYEGLAYIEKSQGFYKLNELDVAKVDLDVPFTKHTLGILLDDGRSCRLIGGYINNKNIKEIHFENKNNTTNVIKIGKNQNTFMDYIIGQSENYIKKIIGVNENYEVIHSYN